MPVKSRWFLLLALLQSGALFSQELAFECDIKSAKKYDTYHVVDRTRPQQYLVLVAADHVEVIVMDSAMNLINQKSYPITIQDEKYYLTEPLSFVAHDGIIHGYFANYGLTVVGFMEFNLRSKKIRRGQLSVDFNRRDEFLMHYVLDGELHIMSTRKKSNILNFYKVISPKNIQRIQYNVVEYNNLNQAFRNASAPKDLDIGVILPGEEPELTMSTKKLKAYPTRENLTITMETVQGTELIVLDLLAKDYKDDVVHYRRFEKSGPTNNSNSFLYNDLHLVARSSGEEILVYVDRKGSTEPLFKERFLKDMEEIPFSNEMANGERIHTASRYYRNNPRDLMRSIDDGNIGLHMWENDTTYIITVGNFEEDVRPLTDPYRSRLAGRNAGSSSYFKTLLSKDFEWLPNPIPASGEGNFSNFFEEKNIKPRYVYAFKYGGVDYVSFQDRKTKKYQVYAVDGDYLGNTPAQLQVKSEQ